MNLIQSEGPPLELSGGVNRLVSVKKVVLICHGSYEERCQGLMRVEWSDVSIVLAVVLATKESYELIPLYRERCERLVAHLELVSGRKCRTVLVSREDPIGWMRELDGVLQSVLKADFESIAVDISTFPRERLVGVFGYFGRLALKLPTIVLYTEPHGYASEKDNEGWLSRGIRSVAAIPGFNGRQDIRKRALLILVVGHERERAYLTIKNVEPDKVLLVNQGVDQYRHGAPRIADQMRQFLTAEFMPLMVNNEEFSVSSRDYIGTKGLICRLIEKYQSDFNLTVASYGPKLQTLGVALAAIDKPSIRVVHAQPQVYNVIEYSSGIGRTWIALVTI